jgi:hypothetical protein
MSNPDLPTGPFPSPVVAEALGLAQSTIGTWASRGYFDHYDYGRGGRGKPMLMSLRDALATALLVYTVRCGIETVELDNPAVFHRYADMWLRGRHQEKRPRQMIVKFYGIPGSPDAAVGLLINADALENPPTRKDVRFSITFEMDEIFGDLIEKLKAAV